MREFGVDEFAEMAELMRRPFHENYFAMYSSIHGGIVTDPILMTMPADDHLLHRGDGIFETMKSVNGRIYNMPAHLERLGQSASKLTLVLPASIEDISRITIDTVRASGKRDCSIRIMVSRGCGSFGVNPYDCSTAELYIIVSGLKKPFMDDHPDGATIRTSTFVSKLPFFASTKSCNYLLNVMMQKESVDVGVDFVVAFDENGFMAEAPTENVGIVTPDKELLFPKHEGILRGTTMIRAAELVSALVGSGGLTGVRFDDISRAAVSGAEEILIVGTTRNIIAVREFDGVPVGKGADGVVFNRLSALLLSDIHENPDMHTVVFD
ncbi:MAG: aminotransferase class IV [Kiritimatiellae bacterium]|nr:aminotransferase class IV [Kiritimatiellia bacterium]